MQDATSLAAAIAAGAVTAPAVMQAALAAAAARGGGALARVEPALGLAGARGMGTGPFAGVPFLGKDLGAGAAGLTPAAGSAALRRRHRDQTQDSDLFARFRALGLVPFGLTTVPEFGLALTSDPAVNPWDPALSPGGSSGGAAAAVASGIVALAHATDAAGSIRVPAAACGLAGLKPSRGAVPQGPDFGNHLMGIAAELVVARSVRDVARVFDGAVPAQAGNRPLDLRRVALVLPGGCDPAAAAAAEQVARLAGAKVETRPAPVGLAARADAAVRCILTASLADWMGVLGIDGSEMSPLAAAVLAEGQAMPAARLFAAARDLARLTAEWDNWLAGADAVIAPVLPCGVPRVGAFDMASRDVAAHFAQMADTAPLAALANAAGYPALVLPVGPGHPRGVEIAARRGSDRALLALGARLAAALPAILYPHPVAGHP